MGEIYCGRCDWQRIRGIPGKGGWFTTQEQSGGGPLIDLGVHMIDLVFSARTRNLSAVWKRKCSENN